MTTDELKSLVNSSNFYSRYDKNKHWDFLAVMAGRAMQSAEFNEIQQILEEKIKSLGNALYADGTIIEGCAISYDPQTKKANLEAGRIFLDGLVYEVEAAELTVPDISNVQAGIWKKSKSVTEYEDNTLNDPAKGTPQYQMPGGYRIVTTAEWGLSSDNLGMPFFPVYGVSGGEMVTQLQEKVNPEYLDTLARYDNHANGHYVVEGLRVTALESAEEGKQTFSISEGEAHINGYEALISHSTRLVTDEEPDLADIKSEVHVFSGTTGGSADISLSHTPVEEIKQVLITKERTVNLTHGGYTGCTDELPDTSVFEIIDVHQGSLVFKQGTDFSFVSDRLSWNLPGEEPAPFSTYSVTYHHRVSISPDSADTKQIKISGAVANSLVEVDYSYRMPRIDLIVIYKDRSVGIVRGVAHRYAPVTPATPPEAICLAEVTQNWEGLPEVKNVAIQRVPVDTLNSMKNQILDLYSLIARNEQRFDIMLNAPTSAHNVFVDPLFDDDMRDAGISQTALIAEQTLQLPMTAEFLDVALSNETALNYSHENIISQTTHTKSMKINPYQNFEPIPVNVKLTPAIDRWTENVVQSVISRSVSFRSSNRRRTWDTLETTITTTEEVSGTLRQISIQIDASGFGPNEAVKVIFDGIEVPCSSTRANAQGIFIGSFKIPAGVPSGTKLVRLQGTFTTGDAYFVGIHEVKTTINYYVRYNDLDPLAQTFTLGEARLISGVDFWLAKKGTSNIRVEIRNVTLGYPTTETLATKVIPVNSLIANGWNRAVFSCPVFLAASTEYAITILSDTSDHEVGIAEIGDWDNSNGWVRSQAYSAGVLLSSSNASTWTAHQNADLAFRLLGAKFSANTKTITLGTFNLEGVTDIMPLAEVETTSSDTYVTFVLKQNNTEIARMQAWQVISFEAPLSGVYTLEAELSGSEKYSPVLGRCPQLLTSKLSASGNYISRAFTCGQNKKIMISTDEYAPHGSSIDIYIQTGEDTWTKADVSESTELGSGWIQRTRFVNCNLGSTRIKIELQGSAEARPLVQTISAVVLDA